VYLTPINDFMDSFDVSKLASYEINESLGNNENTYLTCNNTPTNAALIASVNSLLQKDNFRQALFADLLLSLDSASAKAFIEQLAAPTR
tara:strand:+ start:2066 stop:2332 length:267 start_codon:yes stop_codon:yes gene_type:complete